MTRRDGLDQMRRIAQLQLDRHLAALASARAAEQQISAEIDRLHGGQAEIRAALASAADVVSLSAAHRQHAVLAARIQARTEAAREAADRVAGAQRIAARSLARVEVLRAIAAVDGTGDAPM